MAVYYGAALPSLITLAVICFLPWSCRRSHSLWRALQAYDKQLINAVPTSIKPSPWMILAVMAGPQIPSILLVAVMMTSGGDWHNGWPIFANFRDAVPQLFLFCFVFMATSSLVTEICKPLCSIHRALRLDQKETIIVTNQARKSLPASILHRGRNLMVLILAIIVTWSAHSINDQSAIQLTIISSCVLLIIDINILPLTFLGHSSFRGFVLIPLFFAIIVFIATMLGVVLLNVFGDNTRSVGSIGTLTVADSPSWGLAKVFDDVDTVQAILLFFSFVSSLMAWVTYGLVALAYRYDVAQAGYSALSDQNVDHLILHSAQAVDGNGRTSILLHEAAVSSSRLTSKQLTTFRAAYSTLLTTQILGIFVDAITGWQSGTFYPVNKSQLPMTGNPFSVSIWPFIAYPFVITAMIVSVKRNPNRSLLSLWIYSEEWHLDSKTSVKSPEDESGAELLELGKSSGV